MAGAGSALLPPLRDFLLHALNYLVGDKRADFRVLITVRVESEMRGCPGCVSTAR
jgi:hypothetical protein